MNTKLNQSDYFLLLVYYGISMLLEIDDYTERNNALIEYLIDIPIFIIMSIILVLTFTLWLIPKYIVNHKKYFHFAFFGLLTIIICGGLEYTAGFWSGSNPWKEFPNWWDFIKKSINYASNAISFPLGLLLTKKFYESQRDLLKIEKQQKENELKLLRSQIDPHFLFNNLNTLDSLIDFNPMKAKEYINRLSLIYRYLIQTKDAEVMELSEELKFAENYIFLIKTRFGNDYNFTINVKTSIKDKFVPTGAIQALLENVVKHNKSENNIAINTDICIKKNTLKVVNQKSKYVSKSDSLNTGLNNLKTRYKLLSDKEVIIINTDKEFSVSIPTINLSEEN